MLMNIRYNFRIGPETFWLLFNVVVSTILLDVLATDFTVAGFDIAGWGVGLGIALITRTIPAALIALATDGFQAPGVPKPVPADPVGPVVDEEPLAAPYFPEE